MYPSEEPELSTRTDSESSNTYFRGGHGGQCLELLSHLCQYSESVILVSGVSGVGKSALSSAFKNKEANNFSILELVATEHLTSENLNSQIQQHVDLTSSDQKSIILIDDAQSLNLSVVENLLQLRSKMIEDKIHIVLFATPEFEQKVLHSRLHDEFESHAHIIELESLTLNEVESFLLHQWRAAGNYTQLPFDKSTLKQIYNLSDGIPGEVQLLAKDKLSGKVLEKSANSSYKLVGVVVMLCVVMVVTALMWPQQQELIVPAPSISANVQTSPNEIAKLEHKLEVAEQKIASLQQQLIMEQAARRNSEIKVKTMQDELTNYNKVKPEPKQLPKVSVVYPKYEERIMNSPSSNYTLQLLGTGTKSNIDNIIKKHGLDDKANYFLTKYEGKPWYILVYGNYASRAAAIEAKDKLPKDLISLQPWPREFATIQRTIKNRVSNETTE